MHRHRSGAETSIPGFQERLWGISQPSRRWPLRVRALARLRRAPGPVYCRGIAMAWQVITEGAGPLYAPRRRGELRERLEAVLAALRGAQ